MKPLSPKKEEYSDEIRKILEERPAWIIRNGMWILIIFLSSIISAVLLLN